MNVFDAGSTLVKKNGRGSVVDGCFPMFTTGSGVEADIKAGAAYAYLEAGFDSHEPWISVLIDGERIQRLPLEKGENRILLFRNMNPDEVKHVRITKDVQAIPDDAGHYCVFERIETDGTLCEYEKRPIKLEFIGDSITTGEGIIGAKKLNDWVAFCLDSVQNYTNLTAEALNADYNVISQSGWGVTSAWNNDPNGALPKIYTKTCGSCNALKDRFNSLSEHDFSTFAPDVIVINLGTNDCGSLDQPEFKDPATGETFKNVKGADGQPDKMTSDRFVRTAKAFLETLHEKNPSSKLLWAYGIYSLMFWNEIKTAIEEFKKDHPDAKVYTLEFPAMTDEQAGARFHPGPLAHRMMAEMLTEKIKDIMGLS